MDILELVSAAPDERPYICDDATHGCGKGFARRSDLVRHERIHRDERPFPCEFRACSKRFIQRSALTVHMRTHTGERPHSCEVCKRTFSDSSSLARHRRVHTGRRPYRCSITACDKTFCRKTTLAKHIRNHIGGNDPDEIERLVNESIAQNAIESQAERDALASAAARKPRPKKTPRKGRGKRTQQTSYYADYSGASSEEIGGDAQERASPSEEAAGPASYPSSHFPSPDAVAMPPLPALPAYQPYEPARAYPTPVEDSHAFQDYHRNVSVPVPLRLHHSNFGDAATVEEHRSSAGSSSSIHDHYRTEEGGHLVGYTQGSGSFRSPPPTEKLSDGSFPSQTVMDSDLVSAGSSPTESFHQQPPASYRYQPYPASEHAHWPGALPSPATTYYPPAPIPIARHHHHPGANRWIIDPPRYPMPVSYAAHHQAQTMTPLPSPRHSFDSSVPLPGYSVVKQGHVHSARSSLSSAGHQAAQPTVGLGITGLSMSPSVSHSSNGSLGADAPDPHGEYYRSMSGWSAPNPQAVGMVGAGSWQQ